MAFLIEKIRNNRDFFASTLTNYLVMGGQLIVQIFLIPLYLHYFGLHQFGFLMMVCSLATLPIAWWIWQRSERRDALELEYAARARSARLNGGYPLGNLIASQARR